MVPHPVIELHISNLHTANLPPSLLHHAAATGVIFGFGVNGYTLAVDAMADLIKAADA